MLKCVDMNHMKDAPTAAFWATLAVGGSQLVIPFLEMIGGYCPTLTLLQLQAAALTLAFDGGMSWGLVSKDKLPAAWEDLRWTLVPPGVALLALALPYPLGFLTAAAGTVASLYLDLRSCLYPRWAMALKLYKTLTTVTGLLLAMAAYVLFHNRNKGKKEDDDDNIKDQETPNKEEVTASDVAGKGRIQ